MHIKHFLKIADRLGGGHHNTTLVQRPMQQQPLQPSKMVGTMPRGAKVASSSVTTLPRSSKTGNHSKHVYHHRQLQPLQPLMMSTPRSGSRESGSSSSRTVSRSGSRCALSKSGSRSGSSSALQKARPGTPEGNFINHTRHIGGRVNLNFLVPPYGVAFLNP